ncbi:FeoB-associated Cys-rich membrane protein [Ornithinibacillus halotolerans]|uniref:Uncharacterized protein n=1 Tax=Ornithinibacillus halotolerans TaxID=1274357 RepID=A0A916S5T9_9BACI|nr:FeoB-associated Cys-rich membrane protein [Ornithinibacillus halotolerans]GGA85657.1 hypothetical protein GCM10008025_30800 [Ornithinibacillus halotolerans]
MRKNQLLFTLGLVIGMFILPSILEWFGLPTFFDFLTLVFGEPNVANRIVVGLIVLILVFYSIRYLFKRKETSSK